jgi:hypothetical protein
MDVNLASHAHQVPQVGCPHNDPVIIAKQVNINPIGAILLVIIIKFFVLKIKLDIESKAMQVKEANPIQAEGT